MGQHQAVIYGLDIETDNTSDGLDPAVASVRAVALSGRHFDDLFVGDEVDLLRALDARLAALPTGVRRHLERQRLRPPLPGRPGPHPRHRPRPEALPRPPAHPAAGAAARPRRRLPGQLARPRPPRHLPPLRRRHHRGPAALAALARPAASASAPTPCAPAAPRTSATRRSTPAPRATPAWPGCSPSAGGPGPPA